MPGEDEMLVEIVAQDNEEGEWLDEEEMSLMMIKALVDELSISKPTKNQIAIKMLKRHKENIFGSMGS